MNPSWMQGHTSDIEYSAGYYREQEPALINMSAIMHGIEPVPMDKSFTYCELGCGMGYTSLIMAANHPQGKFIAVDSNPSYISQAKRIAEEAGLDNIEFMKHSFEELVNDSSLLPICGFITFHNISTWVGDENRQYLSDICKRHLKSGGLVYNSYNAQPGWAAVAPLQKTLNVLSQQYSGDNIERFSSAANFINNFRELKPYYFELNSTMLEPRLDNIKNIHPAYLAHEYLHEDWQALYFSDVASNMAQAKLDFVGLASPAEAYSHTIIPEKLKQQLSELVDVSAREMVKDLAYNTSFRKDLYSRGGRQINAQRQVELLNKIQWMLTSPKDQSEFTFNLSVGEVTGDPDAYTKVIKALAGKGQSTEELLKKTKIPVNNLVQILIFLYSNNRILIENSTQKTTKVCGLNKALLAENINQQKALAIAAGKIGTAMLLNPIELAFLSSYFETKNQKKKEKTSIADNMFEELSSKGLSLTISDKTYSGAKMKKPLKEIEKSWLKETLPRLQDMGCL